MEYVSFSQPDLEAHRNSLTLPIPDLLSTLISKGGKKLTAYVAGVDDVKTIDSWIEGEPVPRDAEGRLRLTYQIVMTLTTADTPTAGDLDQVAGDIAGAARAFLAGG
jgi:hypothetical protein